VLAQDFSDFEIIVGDETGAAEQAVAAIADPRIRYHRNPQRLGFSGNHVALLDRARGRYMTVLHDDDWWEPDYLSTLVHVLDADPAVGMAYCGTLLDLDGRHKAWPVPLTPGRHDHILEEMLREEWFMLIIATIWRREVWTGAARQWPDLRCADLQLFLSAADAGWPLFYVPEALAHWSQHSEQSGAWRGTDHGLGVADDVLAFWDGWLAGRPEAQVALTQNQRDRWHMRRARALLLAGRSSDARAALDRVSRNTAGDLPGLRQLSLASRLPTTVIRSALRIKRRLMDPRAPRGAPES
jgi:glycosyltransferase involved in cell wall biosynthesis